MISTGFIIVLITCPDTGIEMRSEEAIAKGIVTEEEVEAFLRMANKQKMSNSETTSPVNNNIPRIKKSSASSSSFSSGSSSSDEGDRGSYRSEITIDFGNQKSEMK